MSGSSVALPQAAILKKTRFLSAEAQGTGRKPLAVELLEVEPLPSDETPTTQIIMYVLLCLIYKLFAQLTLAQGFFPRQSLLP